MQWEKSKSRNACSCFVPQADFFIGTENFNSDVNALVQAIAITVEILFKFLIAISK